MRRNDDAWIKVGEIGVDAGLCWIGDPCYILHKKASDKDDLPPKDIGKDWLDFCARLGEREGADGRAAQWNYDMGHAGLGVTVSTGYGDGCYPVEIQKNREGRVKAVRVVFIGEGEDSDD